MNTHELKTKIPGIIRYKRKMYISLEPGRDNPQVKELMSSIDAEINTFIAVLDALNGDTYLINSYGSINQ